jgi:tRNA(Ile)-lysidine synthase
MRVNRRGANGQRLKISQFARHLLAEWRRIQLPTEGEAVIVAVSGGADSTSVLLAIDELKHAGKIAVDLYVAHLNHGLRQTSAKDARWVSTLAKQLGYSPIISHKNLREAVAESGDNLEQMARNVRYEFLERTARRKKARFVVTGHTMDDQAETVLLRLMRGSASHGLSGIEAIRPLSKKGDVYLARPLLWARREETEEYCRSRHQQFLVDEMNADEAFARVKVRKRLLPLMESFNNRVVEAISRTADLLREDSSLLYENAADLLQKATVPSPDGKNKTEAPSLNVQVLSTAPAALRRRALREWISNARGDARRLEMVHLVAVERLLEGTKGGRVVELPSGGRVTRRRGRLEYALKND